MTRAALSGLAVLLAGCTATFIGDRAYRSAPETEPPPEPASMAALVRDMEVVEPAEPEQLVFKEPVDATKQRFHELSPRRPAGRTRRPRVFASTPAVRLTPPILSELGPSWPGGGRAWFSLRQADTASSLTVFPEMTAEVSIGESRFYTAGPVPGAEVSWSKVAGCDTNRAASTVRWNGFLSKTRTAESLDYFEMIGRLSPKSCRAEASEVRSVTAVAVLPGVIYAARRCVDAQCKSPAAQSVILIAPPAKWMPSTTAQPAELLVPHSGSFSRAEVSIQKGGAGSALFTVDAEHIAKFRQAQNPLSFIGVKTIAISVDVIWPSTAPEPTFSVGLAAVDDPATTFSEAAERALDGQASEYSYSFSDDVLQPDSFPEPRAPVSRGRR
jgi:hypothetical protein